MIEDVMRELLSCAKKSKLVHKDATELDFLSEKDAHSIIGLFHQLDNVIIESIEDESDVIGTPMRADEITSGGIRDKILSNHGGNSIYFEAPKVIEQE